MLAPSPRSLSSRLASSCLLGGRCGIALLLSTAVCLAQDAATLRIVSFNIRYGTAKDGDDHWTRRRENVIATIRDLRPAVLGVQEALPFQLEELLTALPTMRALGRGRESDGTGEHAAILFDHERFEALDHGDFWLSATPEVPGSVGWDAALTRIASWALLRERESGRALKVWNAHFDHRGAQARRESAKLLRARIEASPWDDVLLGDFNAREASVPIRILLDDGALVDAWRRLHPDVPPARSGTFGRFVGAVDDTRIDYVFVDPTLAVRDAGIDRRSFAGHDPSDHYPVWTDITLPHPGFIVRHYDRDSGIAAAFEPTAVDAGGWTTWLLLDRQTSITARIDEIGGDGEDPAAGDLEAALAEAVRARLGARGFGDASVRTLRFCGREVHCIDAEAPLAPWQDAARRELLWLRGARQSVHVVISSPGNKNALEDETLRLVDSSIRFETDVRPGRPFDAMNSTHGAGIGFVVEARTLIDRAAGWKIELPPGAEFGFGTAASTASDATVALYSLVHRAPDVRLEVQLADGARRTPNPEPTWQADIFGQPASFHRERAALGKAHDVATLDGPHGRPLQISVTYAAWNADAARGWTATSGLAAFSAIPPEAPPTMARDPDAAWIGDRVLRAGRFVDFAANVSWRKPADGMWSARLAVDPDRPTAALEIRERISGLRATLQIESAAKARIDVANTVPSKAIEEAAYAARNRLVIHDDLPSAVQRDRHMRRDRQVGIRLDAPDTCRIEEPAPSPWDPLVTRYVVVHAAGKLEIRAEPRLDALEMREQEARWSAAMSEDLVLLPADQRDVREAECAADLGGHPSRMTLWRSPRGDIVRERHVVRGPGVMHVVTIEGDDATRAVLRDCYRAVFDPLGEA